MVPLSLFSQEPLDVDLLTDGKVVHIILQNTPAGTAGFNAYRRGPGDRNYLPLTSSTVKPLQDPYQAYDLFRRDAAWLERKFDTTDPVRLWRKIGINRSYAQAYSLISPGLRMALGRTLIDRSVSPGATYRYRIVLVDRLGEEIDRVDRRIKVNPPGPVEAPGQVEAAPDKDQFTISWEYDEYKGRKGDHTVGFHIYRRKEGGDPQRINTEPVLRIEDFLNYFDSGARQGVSYRFGVQAVDIIGRVSEIVYSDSVRMVDTSPPLVPMGLTAVDQEEGVLLLWNLSPERDVRSYNVYRSASVEGQYTRINSDPVPFDDPRLVDENIVRGEPWFYQVTAVDAAGNESPPSGAVTIIPRDTEAPSAVQGLAWSVNADDRIVLLRWNANSESDIKGYFVYRAEGGKSMTRITPSPVETGNNPRFEDSGFRKQGLLPGREYRYAVSAVDNSYNEGERSEIVLLVPDLEPPAPVFSFSARTNREGNVELLWQPGLSRDLDLHRIYRKADIGTLKVIAELPADETRYLDTETERGKKYSYHLVEVDTSGNASEPSRVREVVPVDSVKPGPPRELLVVKEGSRVRISWKPPEDLDIAGYQLYRAAYPGSELEQLTGTSISSTEYRVRYTSGSAVYTVRAVDTSGNKGPGETVRLEEADR